MFHGANYEITFQPEYLSAVYDINAITQRHKWVGIRATDKIEVLHYQRLFVPCF